MADHDQGRALHRLAFDEIGQSRQRTAQNAHVFPTGLLDHSDGHVGREPVFHQLFGDLA